MQYGVEVPTYRRVGNETEKKSLNLSTAISSIMFIVIGIMLGRVGFKMVDGLYVAPFGISYMLSIIKNRDERKNMIIALSICIGYLSTYKVNAEWYIYVCIVSTIFLIEYISEIFNQKIKLNKIILISATLFILLGSFLGNQSVFINIFFSMVELAFIIPFFFILNYGIRCLEEFNTGYLFTTEELISIAVLICLVVSGIGEVSILGVNLMNITALTFIIIIAYACGSDIGSALGVTMGLIIGIVTNNLMEVTCMYSICGLIVGVFKESGKIISIMSYIVISFMISVYSVGIHKVDYVELLIPAIIVSFVPMKLIKKILLEVNNQEKSKVQNEMQIEGVKTEFLERVNSLKSVLDIIGKSINSFAENDKLLMKNKGTAMVENLADRVCTNCEMNRRCWDKELHNTFSSFTGLILSCENKSIKIPKELDKKCIQRNKLLKNVEDVVNIYTINAALKTRLAEGRSLIVNQISNISYSLEEIFKDFQNDIWSCLEIDKLLRKTLTKKNIKYNDLYSFTDRKGRLKIKVKLDNSMGENYCIKNIIPTISSLVKTPLSLIENEIRIDPNTNECTLIIEETPKYNVIASAASSAKDGEKYSGDSYDFSKNINGEYITILSDGMGSGPEARMESEVAIDIVEKLIGCGFSEDTILNSVNSIMSMKFDRDEKFTTLDMNSIDLYSGQVSFIKVGAVISFIKRGNEVEIINSATLPFGVVDEMDIDIIDRKVKSGDIIITISDGILDVDRNNIGDYSWLQDYLSSSTSSPEELSRDILEKAKELSGGRILDDMTVVVSKIYSAY